jgi:hypothetical protein
MLERLVPSNPALAGDLVEEYQHGRSSAWYWRQVLTAILVGAWSDLRQHQLLALRAIITGWAVFWVFSNYLAFPLFRFDQFLFVTGLVKWFWLNGYGLPDVLQHPLVQGATACALSGWIVGRFSRGGVMGVLVYVASLLLIDIFMVVRLEAREFGNHGRLWFPLQIAATVLLVWRVPALVAGLWAASQRGADEVAHKDVSMP